MLSLKPKHTQYLTYGNPSLEREGYSWCSYQAGQGISPSDYTRSVYIAPRIRRNAQKTSARETLCARLLTAYIPQNRSFFRWGRNDTLGKSHPLLIRDGMRSAGSTMRIVLSTTILINGFVDVNGFVSTSSTN